jgi:hypothetical protein
VFPVKVYILPRWQARENIHFDRVFTLSRFYVFESDQCRILTGIDLVKERDFGDDN